MQLIPRKQCPRCYHVAPMRLNRCTVCGHQLRTQYLAPPPAPPPPQPVDPCYVASLVLALGSLMMFALPLGMSAVVVGVVGIERRGRNGRGAPLAWSGIAIGLLAAIYGLFRCGVRWF